MLIFVIGFLFDMVLELTLVRTGLYIYSQVIPFGSIFTGSTYQFPLMWESLMVTFVMVPAGLLVYRDDTGRTVAEKLAQRAAMFPEPARARNVGGDVRDHQPRLLRLRPASPYQVPTRHLGGLPVAVSGGQSI